MMHLGNLSFVAILDLAKDPFVGVLALEEYILLWQFEPALFHFVASLNLGNLRLVAILNLAGLLILQSWIVEAIPLLHSGIWLKILLLQSCLRRNSPFCCNT